ncbi:hypothetical protein [Acidovorax delafieldii]|uniref:hypothetical protein n=1 Tax=Acidovorax delafieldii TaxID=47920 RepID=UPI003ECC396E
MSAAIDYAGGGEELYTGYQNDGTFQAPAVSVMQQPLDAGGGPPANYGAQVLDIFKFGVGVWNQREARQDMIDLRRWEATNAGLVQQGQNAALYGRQGQLGLFGVLAIGVVLYLVVKG